MVTSGTGHDRCPSQLRDPDGHPDHRLMTPIELKKSKNVSRGQVKKILSSFAEALCGRKQRPSRLAKRGATLAGRRLHAL